MRALYPKLIMVEGIMGAGKTTTAKFVANYLESLGHKTELFLEGNEFHPVDYEYTAFLDHQLFERLCSQFREFESQLRCVSFPFENQYVVPYGQVLHKEGVTPPNELYEVLATHNLYERTSIETYQRLIKKSWTDFAARFVGEDVTVIFECCFIQNPICKLMAQHDAGDQKTKQHIAGLADIVSGLNPVLIYLKPDVDSAIERAMAERSPEWRKSVIAYHVEQAYGKARGLSGLAGFLEFLKQRRAIEQDIIPALPMKSVVVDESFGDWFAKHTYIQEALNSVFQMMEA